MPLAFWGVVMKKVLVFITCMAFTLLNHASAQSSPRSPATGELNATHPNPSASNVEVKAFTGPGQTVTSDPSLDGSLTGNVNRYTNSHFSDSRRGLKLDWFSDPISKNVNLTTSESKLCTLTAGGYAFGNAEQRCQGVSVYSGKPGMSLGNIPGFTGWTVGKALHVFLGSTTSGIHQSINGVQTKTGLGDNAWLYAYQNFVSGATAPSDESTELFAGISTEISAKWTAIIPPGVAAGAQDITFTTKGPNDSAEGLRTSLGQGQWVFDRTNTVYVGNMLNSTPETSTTPAYLTVDQPLTPVTTHGYFTLPAGHAVMPSNDPTIDQQAYDCTLDAAGICRDNKTPNFTFNVEAGFMGFTAGQIGPLLAPNAGQTITITSATNPGCKGPCTQTIQFKSHISIAAGNTFMASGNMLGTSFDADTVQTSSAANYNQGWNMIYQGYAYGINKLVYYAYFFGSRYGIAGSLDIGCGRLSGGAACIPVAGGKGRWRVTMTRNSAGNVIANNYGGGAFADLVMYAPSVRVTCDDDSSFNGTFLNPVPTNGLGSAASLTWADTDPSHKYSASCTSGYMIQDGKNGFHTWKVAEVTSAINPQSPPSSSDPANAAGDGKYVRLGINDMVFTAGHTLEAGRSPSGRTATLHTQMERYTPGNGCCGTATYAEHTYKGAYFTGCLFCMSIQAVVKNHLFHGGLSSAADLFKFQRHSGNTGLVYSTVFNLDNPPDFGLFTIGHSIEAPNGAVNEKTYNILTLAGYSGNSDAPTTTAAMTYYPAYAGSLSSATTPTWKFSGWLKADGLAATNANITNLTLGNWYLQGVLGSGTNPTSTLTLSHEGTSGTATVKFPFQTALGANSTVNGSAICTANGTNCPTPLGGALSNSNCAIQSAAGSGATCSLAGMDGTHLLTINNGTTPTTGNQAIVTFTASRGHTTYCSWSPASAAAAAGTVHMMQAGSATTYTVSAPNTAPVGGAVYSWNIVCP